jgi:hypothetical protein
MNGFVRCLAVTAVALVASATAVAAKPDKYARLPAEAKDLAGFVPKGWKLLQSADGDLNKDGLDDLVGVIEKKTETPPRKANSDDTADAETPSDADENGPPRMLFVAFQKPGGGYSLSVQANKAILRSGDGGAFGDPFQKVEVERGTVQVSYYGGSGERWSSTHKFRFQDGGWFLIGVTTDTSRTDGSDEGTSEDINLLTGKMRKVTTDAKGKSREKMIKRGKRKLVNLVDFDVGADQPLY